MEMMVFDGCFIVELLLRLDGGHQALQDPVFRSDHIFSRLLRDLLLVENQLPFFLLMKLFEMIIPIPHPANSIITFILSGQLPKYGKK